MHQGRGFTGSGQYSAVKKIIAARLPGQCIRDEGLQVQDSILLWKKIIAARLPGQCIRDERLHVQDSILLLEKLLVTRQAGQCIRDERFTGSGQYSAVKKNCSKATRTVHQGRGFTGSG